METLLAFLIAFTITLVFVRRYVKTMAVPKHGAAGASAAKAPQATISCPRCNRAILADSQFCGGCGASLALWNVHRAAVQAGGAAAQPAGKPRPVINASLCIGCGGCVDACPEAGTLALVGGKAILANRDRCVGHAKCVEVCPTSALSLAFGSAAQTLRVPLVKENFETNVPSVYIAGELSGMGLIKTAINEGRLAVDTIRRGLEANGLWRPPEFDPHDKAVKPGTGGDRPYDVLVVGAGPAGLSASLTAQQHGLHYVTIEQGEIASTIRNYPRHKFLMAEPVEMPLYGSLYVGDGTKESLLKVWEAIVANTGVEVRTNERVESIVRRDDVLEVETTKASYRTRNVVLCLGKRGSPRRLGAPGEDLGKVAYRLIEADSYENADILVVGGGDSAIEAALALSKAAKNRVTLSYRGQKFDRARERNQAMLAEAEQKGRIHVMRGSQVREILPDEVQLEAGGQSRAIPNQFVFVLIGGEPPEGFLRRIGIEIVDKVIEVVETYA